MHAKENTAMSSSGDDEVKEDIAEDSASTSASDTSQTTTTTCAITTTSLTGTNGNVTESASLDRNISITAAKDSTKSVNGFVSAVISANGEDSAVETDDSSQDMVIAAEDIKREVDSDCEDTVDGTVLHRLREIDLKIEPDTNSNSSCSLSSFKDIWNKESDASMRQRLFTSLSQSFPGSALSRVLHSMDTMPLDSDDEDLVPIERLSSSCFGAIRMEKEDDDELTSLAWLQDSDLLKNINAGEDDLKPGSGEQKENAEGQKSGEGGGGGGVPQTHPSHVPYNPHKHVNSKPPYSFSCLIFMAVEDSPEKKLPVKDIYNWILSHFPYFQNAPTGWKNSVRHNLSLNKCFKKVDKDKGTSIGKGSLWCIDPEYRPNLLQALRKTPYHPYHQLQMMSSLQPQQQMHHIQGLPSGLRAVPLGQRAVPNTVSPHLFPFLSRRLAHSAYIDRDMQDVANTLIAMKGSSSKNSSGMSSDGSDTSDPNSPRSLMKRRFSGAPKHQGPIIVTAYPNEDHNYSSAKLRDEDAASGTSSIDNEYDFGDEDDDISEPSDYPSDWDCSSDGKEDEVDGDLPLAMQRKRLRIDLKMKAEDKDEEEEKQEGAKLLMSLAGFGSYSDGEEGRTPRKPSLSSSSSSHKTPPSSSKSARSVSSPRSRSSKTSSAAASKSSSFSSSQSSSSSSRAQSSRSLSRTSSSKQSSKTSVASSKSTVATSAVASSKSTVAASASSVTSSKSTVAALASSKFTADVVSLSSSSSSSSSSSKSPDAASVPSAKQVSSPSSAKSSPASSVSSTKSSIIMTRRGKAAAEAAAAAASRGMCTRGKKLNSS